MGELARHLSVGVDNYNSFLPGYRRQEEIFESLDRITKQIIYREVSKYAAENHNEFVAEMFAAIQLGRTFDDNLMKLYTQFGGAKIREYEIRFSE